MLLYDCYGYGVYDSNVKLPAKPGAYQLAACANGDPKDLWMNVGGEWQGCTKAEFRRRLDNILHPKKGS